MKKGRLCMIYCLFLLMMLFVGARLYYISANGHEIAQALKGQYLRTTELVSRKGFVFDRNGELLNIEPDGYIVFVNPSAVSRQQFKDVSKRLSQISEMDMDYYMQKLQYGTPFKAVTSEKLDTYYSKSYIKYKSLENASLLCHILGYEDADGNGVSGVLSAYNDYLNDQKFCAAEVSVSYEADALGRVIAETKPTITDSGYDESNGVYLTIDKRLQSIVEDICDKSMEKGAVVVQSVENAQLLAVVSRPAFEPCKVSTLLGSTNGELLNRAFLGYTPGSVFKTVVACAALEENETSDSYCYTCKGSIEADGVIIRCHNRTGHGELDMYEAFSSSCNPYFIDIGTRQGAEKIIDMAKRMGAGMHSSINLVKTTKGALPNLEKNKSVANLSVGQGELLLTPLEVCSIITTAITGEYKKPVLVKKLAYHGGVTSYAAENQSGTKVLSEQTVKSIRKMLEKCVAQGTGKAAYTQAVTTAGKTATAQSGQKNEKGEEIIHSWFCGYFPAENPLFTVCVLCDGDSENNESPSVIFRKISQAVVELEEYKKQPEGLAVE